MAALTYDTDLQIYFAKLDMYLSYDSGNHRAMFYGKPRAIQLIDPSDKNSTAAIKTGDQLYFQCRIVAEKYLRAKDSDDGYARWKGKTTAMSGYTFEIYKAGSTKKGEAVNIGDRVEFHSVDYDGEVLCQSPSAKVYLTTNDGSGGTDTYTFQVQTYDR